MSFDYQRAMRAREKTIEAVRLTAAQLEVGMNEADGIELLEQTLKNLGSEKKWHPSKFRIGEDTTKAFREKPDPTIKLQERDIFFIDIGPVFDGYEGDYGETFVRGEHLEYQKIADASKEIFESCSQAWLQDKLSGIELYEYAEEKTKSFGFELNTKMRGHYLEEFPHALITKEPLIERSSDVSPNLWVLEILIRHPEMPYGAFFEDLLINHDV